MLIRLPKMMLPAALVLFVALFAAPACAAMGRQAALEKLQERHALMMSPTSGSARELLAMPIMGDPGQVQLALAVYELRSFAGGDEPQSMRLHLSRLLAENQLGRPPTRVKDVAAALAHEQAQTALFPAFRDLQEEVFRKLVKLSFPAQEAVSVINGVAGLPVVRIHVRQAAAADLEMTGSVRIRIPQAQGGGEAWTRGCNLPPASNAVWSPVAGDIRTATLECRIFNGDEAPGDFARALSRLRTGQADMALVPENVMFLPVALEASLPYEQAVELMSRGSCFTKGNCPEAFMAWLKEFPRGVVVLGFFGIQLVLAAALFLLSGLGAPREGGTPMTRRLVYLGVVVLAHAGMVGMGLNEGALLIFMGWIILGLPLFLPGMLIGLLAVSSAFYGPQSRGWKVVLGVLAVTFPMLEQLLMSGILHSGYRGG